ncbi:hypothetical protein D3C71_2175310 [compost metagenome]
MLVAVLMRLLSSSMSRPARVASLQNFCTDGGASAVLRAMSILNRYLSTRSTTCFV